MGGGTRTTTTQEAKVPGNLEPLLATTAARGQQFQQAAPLEPFLEAKPLKVAGLSEREKSGLGKIGGLEELGKRRVTGANLPTSPSFAAAQEAYNTAIRPGIENTAAVSGLGRSTALTNADAAARAAYLQPTIEAELAREERGNQNEAQMLLSQIQAELSGGGLERGIEQAGYESEQADRMRRQALAEQALFLPMGQLLPSTIGQQSTTRGKSGVFTGGA
jgi:hypothetical protein